MLYQSILYSFDDIFIRIGTPQPCLQRFRPAAGACFLKKTHSFFQQDQFLTKKSILYLYVLVPPNPVYCVSGLPHVFCCCKRHTFVGSFVLVNIRQCVMLFTHFWEHEIDAERKKPSHHDLAYKKHGPKKGSAARTI